MKLSLKLKENIIQKSNLKISHFLQLKGTDQYHKIFKDDGTEIYAFKLLQDFVVVNDRVWGVVMKVVQIIVV